MSLDPSLAGFAESRNTSAPRWLGSRHDDRGNFLPEPGNTVVCHLVPDSATERALIKLRRRMLDMPDADRLAFTPVSSLHMTLFQGIIEGRRTLPYWPADRPLDTPIAEMTARLRTRLDGFRGGEPFRMRAVSVLPTGLVVEPAGPADRLAIRVWRDRLADRFGYRHPDHADYVFHITLAYMMKWLADAAIPAWESLFMESIALIEQEAPILDLRPPAFCSFADMNHFEEAFVLEPGANDSAAD